MANKGTTLNAAVGLYPSMDGFFEAVDREMSKISQRLSGTGTKLGQQFAGGFNKGFANLSPQKNVQKAFDNVGKTTSSSGTRAGTGFLSGLGSVLSRGGSAIGRVFSGVGSTGSLAFADAGRRSGYSFAFSFQNMATFMIKRAMVAVGLAGAAAIPTQVIGGGLARALNIETAQATMGALGYSADSVAEITNNALAAVEGTIYSLDEAIKVSTNALAAGIKQGDQLTGYLRSVAGASALTGASLEDMGYVYNKITANGVAWTEELNMVADRGVPIFQWLAESYGVSQAALRKMVQDGEVSAERFLTVMNDKVGKVATMSADTTKGAFQNMRIAMSRFGAAVFTYLNPIGKVLFNTTRSVIDSITKMVQPGLQKFFGGFTPKATEAIEKAGDRVKNFFNGIGENKKIQGFIDRLKDIQRFGGEIKKTFADANIFTKFTDAFKTAGVGGDVDNLFYGILNALVKLAPIVATVVKSIFDRLSTLVPFISEVFQTVERVITKVSSSISAEDFFNVFKLIGEALKNVMVIIEPLINQLLESIFALLPGLTGAFKQAIDSVLAVAPILTGILVAILPVFVNLLVVLLPVATAILNIATNILQFFGPALVWLAPIITAVVLGLFAIKGVIAVWLGVAAAIKFATTAIGAAQVAVFAFNTFNAGKIAVWKTWWLELASAIKWCAVVLWQWMQKVAIATAVQVKNLAVLVAQKTATFAVAAAQNVAAAAQWALNAAMTANPIVLIITLIVVQVLFE